MDRNVKCIEKNNYKKYIFSEDQKQDIVELYQSGNSTVLIGKMYNVGHKVIAKVLSEFNIQRTGVGKRRYKINEDYFDQIDTPDKAYILGFLWADGHNEIKKGTVSMSLEEGDKDILNLIRLEVGSEKELEFLNYSEKHDFGYNYKNQYRMLFFSKHMCESLYKIGMTSNKSLTAKFPNISNNLIRHFIRGLFDGDGSVYRSQYKNKNSYHYTLTITSTKELCESLVSIVEDKIGINCHIYDASNHNGITKVFNISGKLQIKKFMDWMYENSNLKLERKYNRYIEYFYNDINNSCLCNE